MDVTARSTHLTALTIQIRCTVGIVIMVRSTLNFRSGRLMQSPTEKRYEEEITDYRRGFVEGQAGERDAYLLFTGCTNVDEYNRGFIDGMATQEEACEE